MLSYTSFIAFLSFFGVAFASHSVKGGNARATDKSAVALNMRLLSYR